VPINDVVFDYGWTGREWMDVFMHWMRGEMDFIMVEYVKPTS